MLGTGESTRDIAGALNHSQSQITCAIKCLRNMIKLLFTPPKKYININELVFYLMDEWVVIICKN